MHVLYNVHVLNPLGALAVLHLLYNDVHEHVKRTTCVTHETVAGHSQVKVGAINCVLAK